jgi:hypothetical protein
MPANTWVMMKTVAGQPTKRPFAAGKVQTRFHQFPIVFADSFPKPGLPAGAESTLGASRGSSARVETFLWPKSLGIFDQPANKERPGRSPCTSQLGM